MPGAQTQEEIIKNLGDISKNFEAFKKTNEESLKEMATKGHVDSLLEAQLKKQNDEFTKQIEKLEAAIARGNKEDQDKKHQDPAHLKEIKRISNQLMLTGQASAEDRQKFLEHCAKGYDVSQMDKPEAKLLSTDIDPRGGYLVRPEVSDKVTQKIFEGGIMRQLAEVQITQAGSFEEPYDNDEPDSGWVGERDGRAETDTNDINMIVIPVHELYANPYLTQKIIDDGVVDVEAWHQNKIIQKFGRDEGTAFISGNGVKKPKGILSYDQGDGFNKVQQVALGNASAFTADGLIDLQNALLEEFQVNAKWLTRRENMAAIRKLKAGDGHYLLSIGAGLGEGFPMAILGKEVRFDPNMPAVQAGALSIAYGDYKQGYLILDRVGIRVLRDPYTTKGRVSFYTTKRVGGGVRQFQAIKIGKIATAL